MYIGDWPTCPFESVYKGCIHVCSKDLCEFFRARDGVCLAKKLSGCSDEDAKVKLLIEEVKG